MHNFCHNYTICEAEVSSSSLAQPNHDSMVTLQRYAYIFYPRLRVVI